jgi:hypothetical protein
MNESDRTQHTNNAHLFGQIECFAVGLCVMEKASIDFAKHWIVRLFQSLTPGGLIETKTSIDLPLASCKNLTDRI